MKINIYIKSTLIILLCSVVIFTFKNFIEEYFETSFYIYLFLEFGSIVLLTIIFLSVLKLLKQLEIIRENILSRKTFIFFIYVTVLFFIIISLDFLIMFAIFMYSNDIIYKSDVGYYLNTYFGYITRYLFNFPLTFHVRLDYFSYILWMFILIVFLPKGTVFTFMKHKIRFKSRG